MWHRKRELEDVARSDFQAVSIEGDGTDFVYIFGGKDYAGLTLKSVLKYDTIMDIYSYLDDMPVARARYAAAVMKNDLNEHEVWILGGIASYRGHGHHALCPMVYNSDTEKWRNETTRCLPSAVKDACAATGSNNAIYLIGGYGADYTILNSTYRG